MTIIFTATLFNVVQAQLNTDYFSNKLNIEFRKYSQFDFVGVMDIDQSHSVLSQIPVYSVSLLSPGNWKYRTQCPLLFSSGLIFSRHQDIPPTNRVSVFEEWQESPVTRLNRVETSSKPDFPTLGPQPKAMKYRYLKKDVGNILAVSAVGFGSLLVLTGLVLTIIQPIVGAFDPQADEDRTNPKFFMITGSGLVAGGIGLHFSVKDL